MSKTDISWLFTILDCGDNSCLFRDRSKLSGMRTNGGVDVSRILTVNDASTFIDSFISAANY